VSGRCDFLSLAVDQYRPVDVESSVFRRVLLPLFAENSNGSVLPPKRRSAEAESPPGVELSAAERSEAQEILGDESQNSRGH
jgi:hypothetical protein